MFAKLFGSDDDQVLVMLHTNHDGDPCISFFYQPPNFGVCDLSISFTDDDKGWDLAKTEFSNINESKVRAFLADLKDFSSLTEGKS